MNTLYTIDENTDWIRDMCAYISGIWPTDIFSNILLQKNQKFKSFNILDIANWCVIGRSQQNMYRDREKVNPMRNEALRYGFCFS